MRIVKDKVAFITGGASGIGLGMAQAFVDAGMKAVLADIRADHIEEAIDGFAKAGLRNRVRGIKLDVTDRKAYARAADDAEEAFGKVHVLCNNAGIDVGGKLEETKFDDWDWGMDVMLGGAVNGILTLVPRIRAHGEGGHIVNTASMAALVPAANFSIYCTAKAALVGLAEALRPELGEQNIGVSVLCPGPVKSNIHESAKSRPARYRKDSGLAERQRELGARRVSDTWMDARECGERVLKGIRRNDLYILTHPEFKEGAAEHFQAILDSFPDEPPNRALVKEFGFIMRSPMFAKATAKAPAKAPAKKAKSAHR
jgi:NAD(P)-dependent dehydrogenase (short-subunit alcohol dehydrogenase family)